MTLHDALSKKVNRIITRKGVQLADQRIKKIMGQFRTAVTMWRLEVKSMLSVPAWKDSHGRYKKNTDDMPHMRSGDLIKSIPLYKITARKTSGPNRKALDLGQTNIQLTSVTRAPWTTYGAKLNEWSNHVDDTNLDGWKGRAYDVLQSKINERVRRIEGV